MVEEPPERESAESAESDERPHPTILRMLCECGGPLGLLELPRDEFAFTATCPGCGTRYRRPMHELVHRAEPHTTTSVVLPRGRPRT